MSDYAWATKLVVGNIFHYSNKTDIDSDVEIIQDTGDGWRLRFIDRPENMPGLDDFKFIGKSFKSWIDSGLMTPCSTTISKALHRFLLNNTKIKFKEFL